MNSPFFLSLKIAIIATFLTASIGLFLSYRSLRWKTLRSVSDVVFMLPLVLPPTVLGFFLLVIFNKQYALGSFLDTYNIGIVFTWWGGVLASFLVSFPLMYRTAQSAMEQMDENLCHAGRTLGMKEWAIFWKIVVPNCMPSIISGTILAFARAFGEFGAIIMIAGNIPGKTQTISMAIYSAMQAGDFTMAYTWVGIMVGFSAICIVVMNISISKKWKKVKG